MDFRFDKKAEAFRQEIREFVAEIKAHPWRLMKKGSGDDDGKKFLLF